MNSRFLIIVISLLFAPGAFGADESVPSEKSAFTNERSKIFSDIQSLEKRGVNVKAYKTAWEALEKDVESGKQKDEIQKKIDSLQRSITHQMTFVAPRPVGQRQTLVVSSTVAPNDPGTYGAYLAKRLKRHWFPFLKAGDLTTVVKFVIEPNGTAKNLAIAQSSGNQLVDNAALKAVEDSAPFGSLPVGLNSKPLRVTKIFNLKQVNEIQFE